MKKLLDAIPAILLISSAYYIAINSTDIGPVIAFVFSSTLFAYQQYLLRLDAPDAFKHIEKIHEEIAQIKNQNTKELTDLKSELAKFSLSMSRIPNVAEKPKERTRVQF